MEGLSQLRRLLTGPKYRRISRTLGRPPASQAEAALREAFVAEPKSPKGSLALGILLAPRSQHYLERASDLVERRGLTLGGLIGSGVESAVFEVGPSGGPADRVLKLSTDPFAMGPYTFPDVVGVFPYEVSEKVGPYRLGVQQRVTPGPSDYLNHLGTPWEDRVNTLWDVLDSQGYTWGDHGMRNMGISPEGQMGVIDGWLTPTTPRPRALSLYPNTEERIRALRVSPPGP